MKATIILLAIASHCLATPSPRIGDFVGFGKGSLAPQVTVSINNRETVKVTLQVGQGSVTLGGGAVGASTTSFTRVSSATIKSGPMGVECLFTATQKAPASPQLSGRFTKYEPFTLMFPADGLSCFIPSANVVRVMVTPLVEKKNLIAVELTPNNRGETSIGRDGQTYPIKNALILDGPPVACSIIYERSDSGGQGQFMHSTFTNSRQFYGNLQKASDLYCERRSGRVYLPRFGNN